MLGNLVLMFAVGLAGDMPVEEKKPAEAQVEAKPQEAGLDLTRTESLMLEQTNAQRVMRGLKPLVIDPTLVESARQHANWMASTRNMRHTTKPVGENIAMGQTSVGQVINVWMNSSGHRANILGRGWNRIGAAAYTTPEGRIYWCLQFLR